MQGNTDVAYRQAASEPVAYRLVSVFFNWGSAEPKGSASGIRGFCWTAGAQ